MTRAGFDGPCEGDPQAIDWIEGSQINIRQYQLCCHFKRCWQKKEGRGRRTFSSSLVHKIKSLHKQRGILSATSLGEMKLKLNIFGMFFLNIIDAYHSGLRNSCSIFRTCLHR